MKILCNSCAFIWKNISYLLFTCYYFKKIVKDCNNHENRCGDVIITIMLMALGAFLIYHEKSQIALEACAQFSSVFFLGIFIAICVMDDFLLFVRSVWYPVHLSNCGLSNCSDICIKITTTRHAWAKQHLDSCSGCSFSQSCHLLSVTRTGW